MAKSRLLLFVLGIAIGAAMGFAPPHPPAQVKFEILSSGKLYLSPDKGDVIKWKHQSGQQVHIHFPFNSPCSEPDGSDTCTVTNARGAFTYSCTDNNGSVICTDPGIDPNSGGDGTIIRPSISASGLTINSQVAALQIGCDSSGNVAVLDSNSKPAPAINAGSTIQWTAPSMEFAVSEISPAASCVGGSRQGRVQWCNAASGHPSPVKYRVQVSGPHACQQKKEGTFSFTLK